MIFSRLTAQSYAITAAKQLAMPVVATGVVVDAIAVANVEAVLGAIPPDRALHEPRKRRREGRIELASIDVRGEQTENAGASARPVAPLSVGMIGAQPPQDPGSVQEIMDQGVDGHEGRADFEPQRPLLAGAQQQRRQRHRQDLVGHPIDVAQRPNDGLAQGSEPIRRLGIHRAQLPINPADEIVIGNIPHEQEQAVRHLVEAAVAQRVAGQWAGVDVARLRARVGSFVVSAVVEPPVTAELRARRACAPTLRQSPPSGPAVRCDVPGGDRSEIP